MVPILDFSVVDRSDSTVGLLIKFVPHDQGYLLLVTDEERVWIQRATEKDVKAAQSKHAAFSLNAQSQMVKYVYYEIEQ